jgi:isopenicillin-N N-acyltransferase-like protein
MEPFKMHLVELGGSPRERGRTHGEQLRTQIQALFDYGRKSLQQAGGPSLEDVCTFFLHATNHQAAARRWTPGLVEEIAGIAEGADVHPAVLWSFQLQDESYWFNTGQLEHFSPSTDPDRCSSLGIPGQDGRPALLAQNLDTPTLYNGAQTLLHIRYPDSDREAYVVTEPGLVGICGLNSSPLGVCQNTLALKLNYDRDGLPAMLVARGMIDQPDLDSARRFLHTIRHASGINYMIADSQTVEDYECSPNQVRRFLPQAGGDRLAHTNHPLANTDRLDPQQLSEAFRQLYQGSNEHSFSRLGCLDRCLSADAGPVDVARLKQILSSHESAEFPVCRHPQPGADPMRGMTNDSLIMVMSKPAELHVTSGPPCTYEYKTFRF